MRIAIVFNPGSGPRAASAALSTVVSALASHNHELEVINSQTQPDFERHLQNRAETFERVIAIGGDGTLNGVVNGIVHSGNPELPVAFVPTGRGKDTSRSLPSWNAQAFHNTVFELAEISPVDLIQATLGENMTRFGINIADIGLAAQAAVIANGLPRWLGSLSYVGGAVRSIVPPQKFDLQFRLDGNDHEVKDALLLSICNGKTFGGGIHIAPGATCVDGLLDIVVVHHANLTDLAFQLGKLKKGTLKEHPALLRWQGRSITIQPTTTPWYEMDGEQLSTQPIRFDVAPLALNWVIP